MSRGWPTDLVAVFMELQATDPDALANAQRLGDLRFAEARDQFIEDLQGHTNGLRDTVEQMVNLSPREGDAASFRSRRDQLESDFNRYASFFRDSARQYCLTARIESALDSRATLGEDDIEALRTRMAELEKTADEFQRLAPLVEAQRKLVGEAGVAEPSQFFDERARDHAKSFRRWAIGLLATVVVVAAGTVAMVYFSRPPDDATNGQIASHIILDVLIVGFAIFALRFVAIQTRAHRHMQFVAKNKANALATFNLIVTGQEEAEVRANVALALAQAVFKSDDGIFSDASGDTVTVVERVSAALSRTPPSA